MNKADGDLKPAAVRTCADYTQALRLLRRRVHDPDGFPKAIAVSALQEDGLAQAWAEMQALSDWRREHGHWDARRAGQARHWFEEEVRQGLLARLSDDKDAKAFMDETGQKVAGGSLSPSVAASLFLDWLKR